MMTRFHTRTALTVLAIASMATACSDTTTGSGATTDIAAATSSTADGSPSSTATSVPATTEVSPTSSATTATATAAPAASTTVVPACEGTEGIAPGPDIGTVLHGDIDGDLNDDTITEYSLDGVPHVHALLATGGHSDAEVPIGFADHVQISFEDFDYALGAATPPPRAVLAIGATKAGTAAYTFPTLTTDYCIRPWHLEGGGMFVGRLSAAGPYEGLSCETTAGNRYYSLNEAVQTSPGGDWTITQTVINHDFTLVQLDPPHPTFTMPDGPAVQPLFGDFSGCDHEALFS